jgi:hypothetical protein
LDILGERESRIGDLLNSAQADAGAGDLARAAGQLVTAASLDSDQGIPFYQYTGPELHTGCMTAPQACLTRQSGIDAVSRALDYLLGSPRVMEAVRSMPDHAVRGLLPHVALQCDPHGGEFLQAYRDSLARLKRLREGALEDLRTTVTRIAEVVAALSDAVEKSRPQGDRERDSWERLRRTAGGLAKDFADSGKLAQDWQLRRLRYRLQQLVDAGDELDEIRSRLSSAGADDSIGKLQGVIREITDRRVIEAIDETEGDLLGIQTDMLGRAVHSQEHWQFLREIAFKYPVSPLMCCLQKLNDRYLVVPVPDGEIPALLTEGFGRAG